ncbi:MAG: thiol:disulfide interchange protein DsbA/DsbL [Burkholderiaceae bacterium]|nr:thiol:disulfide interchange protein DsbA/DsbL [Burkholderiaceae bacterium]
MSLKNFFVRSLAICALSATALLAPVAQAQTAAQPYITLEKVQPSDTAGKIEVLEFFAYTCSHCNTMEPMVESWAKTLPENVVLQRVPVAFNASMADLQKLYYSLESMGRLDLHPAVFAAIHDKREKIYTAPAIFDWIAQQGVDRKAFEDVFNSFGIQSKVTRANTLAQAYQIEGTPSIAVGGKYVTSPSMTNSYEGTITQAQKLVDMLTK